ncbi:MAG: tetratricopeptide repeat protein [Acidobacteriia bacterium]|nr:tetratricopeptide repeat protein [Terriglobia bacterium]
MIDKRAPRFWFSIYAFTAVIMCIAVGVFAWLASESRKEAGEGRTANARPPAHQRIPAERLQLLAQFEAPPYSPSPSEQAAASPRFRKALDSYSTRDYTKAISELQALAASQPDFVPARFYLGICLLLTNDRAAGMQQLRAVIAAPASPYREPAHFYLAKALLGAGDLNAASEQLEAAIAMHGELEKQAQVLLAQVR